MRNISKLDHAKKLADHGLSVIPVNANDKIPCIKWTPYTSRLASEEELKQWFGNFPNRNIGIVTGAVSGVVVVDVDKPDAFNLDLPRTPTAKTGKGLHYYFKHHAVGNAKLPFGDLKSDGGYVVAPPSTHENGSSYEWLVSFDDAPLAELPASVIELTKAKVANDNPHKVESETTPYGRKALRDECEKLSRLTKGDRNNQLNIVANKAGSLMASGDLSYNDAMAGLLWACRENGSWQENARECGLTIKSGLTSGLRNPREKSESVEFSVDEPPVTPGKLLAQFASEIDAEAVPWLWKPVLIKGAITFLAGDAGQGKSTIAYDIAARISNGDRFPASDEYFEQGKVVYMSNEDQGSYLIRPRLEAAGADLEQVIISSGVTTDAGERSVDLVADIKLIEGLLEAHPDISLIVLDPFNDYLGKSDINDMGQTKRLLAPINRLAKNYNVAILIVHHFNKGANGKASNRMAGSTALRSTARAVFFVDRDPGDENKRILVCDKNNYANDRAEYRCTIKLMDLGKGVEATYLEWDEETFKRSSDEVLLDAQTAPQRKKAIELILALYAEAGTDTLDCKVIRKAIEEAGIYPQVLYDAQKQLKIIPDISPTDSRMRVWKLPKAA